MPERLSAYILIRRIFFRLITTPLLFICFSPILLCRAVPVVSGDESEWVLDPGEIPEYVLKHCPVVHLYSEEVYLPYDINTYVSHFYPLMQSADPENLTRNAGRLMDLGDLEFLPRSEDVYLTAQDDFASDPEWITGEANQPNLENGKCKAPATLIVVDKGDGWVDAFWFYFYSFNLGPFVMGGGPYGNHVGDWEHSLVRFYKGEPQIVWMSAHSGGSAYRFDAMEKYDQNPNRPIIFSARGTHANYPTVGQHSHDLPFWVLSDFTDRGPIWDPSLNYLGFTYDGHTVTPAENKMSIAEKDHHHGSIAVYKSNWLLFEGHWGDKQLAADDPRQKFHPFSWKFIDGPLGPLKKNLMREEACTQPLAWWNIWGGCRIRRTIKHGEEWMFSEGTNCAGLLENVPFHWLRKLFAAMTWGGGVCLTADRLFG